MAKVCNEVGRTVTLLRWRILPDGRVISPRGEIQDELPDEISYSAQARNLMVAGAITIQGAKTAEAIEKRPPEVDPLKQTAVVGPPMYEEDIYEDVE